MLRCSLPIYTRTQCLGITTLSFQPCFRLATTLQHRRTLCSLRAPLAPRRPITRQFSTEAPTKPEDKTPEPSTSSKSPTDVEEFVYEGPLTTTFRRLKIFSLSSLAMSFAMTPFLFIVETASSLPLMARAVLALTAMGTSSISTALIAWCGRPYVTTLRRIPAAESSGAGSGQGLEMTTLTLGLHPHVTRVYDTAFLVPTNRPFATWELAEAFRLSAPEVEAWKSQGLLPREETVAETRDQNGEVIGRWIVRWDENGTGACHAAGKVARYFNVHKELLEKSTQ